MRDYRCYFLDGYGHVLFPADIGAEDLEAAKRHSFEILQHSGSLPIPPSAIEIWEEDVVLFRS